MITTYATPGNMRLELLESVRARGHEVTVIAPEPPESMAAAVTAFGGEYLQWTVDRTAIDPASDGAAMHQLNRLLRAHRPDVVLAYQIKAVLLAPIAAKLARVGRVVALVNGLGSVFDDFGFGLTWKATVARLGYRASLLAVDHVVFQNADDPQLLLARRVLRKRASWETVPGTGVDVERFVEQPLPSGPPTFTLISRLLVSKGVRDFATAARIVRASAPHARFRLVGNLEKAGHPDAVAHEEIDRWVDEGVLDYLGFRADVAELLAESTTFVLPSYYREGVPRTNLEALAIGRPIVTTDSVGCRDTVDDGRNGFLVAPRDPAALADRLLRYTREPSLAIRHGHSSRALAEAKFDIRLVNAQMRAALGLDARS